jgi:ribulose kinase
LIKNSSYVIGIDFGTDSVRSIVVDTSTGQTAGSGVSSYELWAKGLFCDPTQNRYRQHPLIISRVLSVLFVWLLKTHYQTVLLKKLERTAFLWKR